MVKTDDILAELEHIGATGVEKVVPIKAVEEVRLDGGSPSPRLLDERGKKMVELSDLVIEEFDRFIESAARIRGAVAEMRDMWRAVPLSEPAETLSEEDASGSEFPEVEELEEGEYALGTPSPMGHISVSIPESEPLPPEVANLTDADLSMPSPPPAVDWEGEVETTNEGEDDGTEVQETP